MKDFRNGSRTRGGQAKEERYDWAKPGEPGELTWVPKDRLEVDPTYQREATDAKVLAIAAKFSWPAFGVALIARRSDGRLFVVDAQHRVLAAMRRTDVVEVPCIIFNAVDASVEAVWFLQSNTHRKPVTAIAKHRAEATSGDEAAQRIEELARKAGRTVSPTSGPNTLTCVAVLRRELGQDAEALQRVWPLVIALCEGKSVHEKLVAAFCYVERRALGSLTDPRWTKRALSAGAGPFITAMADAVRYHQKSGPRVWADGVLRTLNRGLRDEARLTLRGEEK